jgi:hypothetical protein
MKTGNVSGPAGFFFRHLVTYWLALAVATATAVIFVLRAARSCGSRRWFWLGLTVEQLLQVAGIGCLRRRMQRPSV